MLKLIYLKRMISLKLVHNKNIIILNIALFKIRNNKFNIDIIKNRGLKT